MSSYLATYTEHDNYTYVRDLVLFWNIMFMVQLWFVTYNASEVVTSTMVRFVIVAMYGV